ncbi:MAG: ADP-ribosylglycohydrolase family protein [Candidatus Thorarchaeota archaeon]
MAIEHSDRLERAKLSLIGLSVGDAFGESFFDSHPQLVNRIAERRIPPGRWPFTDDTMMALSIVSVLKEYKEINQDALAASFARNFDPVRGYGLAMHHALPRMAAGERWSSVASNLFGGEGSFGNGASMRVAPVGGYFADDILEARRNAALSAEVTHTHPEAAAGAIAVGLAAAWAARMSNTEVPTPGEFIEKVVKGVPDSMTRRGILKAQEVPPLATPSDAAAILGCGQQITTQDTVPFVIWCAAHYLEDYENALWNTVSAFGDMDTTCAMVGGIVVLYSGIEGIPKQWLVQREALPDLPI